MTFTSMNITSHEDQLESSLEEEIWLRHVLYNIRMCFLPIVFAGTITNILNFIVLSKKEMRYLSTSVYLLALAIADLGVMYLELFRVWFEWMDFVDPEVYFSDWYCRIVNYGNGVSRDFSNWLVACLAMERVIMVASPHRAKTWCSLSRAKKITCYLFITVCIPHIHCLIWSVARKETWWVCWEDDRSQVASIIAAIVELGVGYTVVIVVFLLNVTLTLLLVRMNLPCIVTPKHSKTHRQRHHRRLTRTLIFIAIVFLLFETPRIITSFFCRFVLRTPVRRIILNISFVLSGINHASNFFVYILASPRFRHIVVVQAHWMKCRCSCRRRGEEDTGASDCEAVERLNVVHGNGCHGDIGIISEH